MLRDVPPGTRGRGDYYDFLELTDKTFGIAIGDVSGKGIPASLLMANVNKLVYATSPTNWYATFFYAQYDPGQRRLKDVNVGHNLPLVLQQNSGHFK